MNGVIATSIGTAVGLYLLVAFTGYMSYGTPSPRLQQLRYRIKCVWKHNLHVRKLRSRNIWKSGNSSPNALLLPAASSPLSWFPRQSLRLASRHCKPTSRPDTQIWSGTIEVYSPIPNSESNVPRSDPRFAVLTALILTASYAVAMTVSSLDRVLAFVGSTGSTAISFILPGLFYHRMTRRGGLLPRTPAKDDDDTASLVESEEGSAHQSSGSVSSSSATTELDNEMNSAAGKRRARRRKVRRNTAVGLVGYGIVIMIVCLGVNIVVGRGAGH